MKQLLISFSLVLFVLGFATGQAITGTELVGKAIQYHDPNARWEQLNTTLQLSETRPGGPDRSSTVRINLPQEFFQLDRKTDTLTVTRGVENGLCFVKVNGSTSFDSSLVEPLRLQCDRSFLFRDYYQYLYGLPMKLKDPGTIVHDQVEKADFMGMAYLKLKVTYRVDVGADTWYFYFNPDTYAMEAYQFYHDEAKNDGEYITLDGIKDVEGIKMPKVRKWYINKDDRFLGTDTLE